MIALDYCQLMVRYNTWQNNSLLMAADTLDDKSRRKDRGAFFGSIAATMDHIYWGDMMWLERLSGNERPQDQLLPLPAKPPEWEEFKSKRRQLDKVLQQWVLDLNSDALEGQVRWYPPSGGVRIEKSRSVCIVGLFNHQTHHRGQVHCMLTSAGAQPEATDLFLLA